MGWRSLFAVASATLAMGCTGSALGPDAPPIARVWESKCGACHTPVEPQTRTRAYLGDALGRHRARLALSEPEWEQMKDFLAKP